MTSSPLQIEEFVFLVIIGVCVMFECTDKITDIVTQTQQCPNTAEMESW